VALQPSPTAAQVQLPALHSSEQHCLFEPQAAPLLAQLHNPMMRRVLQVPLQQSLLKVQVWPPPVQQLPSTQLCVEPQTGEQVGPTQASPWRINPWLQVKSHFCPSQLAVALAGTGHGVHELPQLATLVLVAHWPLHR
jgi:hypothetical protein